MFFRSLTACLLAVAVPAGAASITGRIAGPDGGWDYASVDIATNRLFVARSDGVMTVNLTTGAVTPRLVVVGRTHAVFVIPGVIGVVTSTAIGGVLLFDAKTGVIAAAIPTGKKPDAAVYDQGTRMVYVMDNDGGGLAIIDPRLKTLAGTIQVGGALEFAVVDGHGHLFVNVEDTGELVMIDLAARKVVRRTKLTGCEEPNGLALTKAGVLISACGNNIAKTSDAKSGRLLADIPIGSHPDAVLYDPKRDRAYVTAGGDGTLTVINTAGRSGPHAIATVLTQISARNGAVDPVTGKIYLPAAKYAAAVGADRPKALPGSFEILVIN